MDIICCNYTYCQYVVKFSGRVFGSCLNQKLSSCCDRRLKPVVCGSQPKFLQGSNLDHPRLRRLERTLKSRTRSAPKGYEHGDPRVLSETIDPYVLDGKEGVHNKSIPKVLIPSLPDETKGESAASITGCSWEWKPKLSVYYEKAGCDNVDSPPVLFLPGFGVGSFHYEKQLKDLGRDFRVLALDFLGQGLSLPHEDPTWPTKNGDNLKPDVENSLWGFGDETEPWAEELVYSADLWKDQVHHFIKEVIKEPVYLVGNSLGGYIAVYVAACYPDLVKGVTLLNATPFWGFLPNPVTSPKLSRIFPWAGTFPIPARVRSLMEIVVPCLLNGIVYDTAKWEFFDAILWGNKDGQWQKISDPESIAEILKQVYADHSTDVDKVFSRIMNITKHPGAAASFASIMFAPTGQLTFKEALSRCEMSDVPVCLMYGREDPWVTPVWGLRVKNQLPEAPYYEMSLAGHCPHDEIPEVVNFLLRGWIRNVESQGSAALPLLDTPEDFLYDFVRDAEFVRESSKRLATVKFYGSRASFWERLVVSLITSRFRNVWK